MREQPVDRYPLAWPVGWPRAADRKRASFGQRSGSGGGRKELSIPVAIDRLMRNCALLGAEHAVLSTNVELNMNGTLRAKSQTPDDPGVALYFRHRGKPIALACDKWDRVADNINAVSGHIDAIRRMDRYGVGRLEQALAGYQRMLPGRRAWFDVLGLRTLPETDDSGWQVVEAHYRRLALVLHPDKSTGSHEQFTELNEAYQTAKQEFGQ